MKQNVQRPPTPAIDQITKIIGDAAAAKRPITHMRISQAMLDAARSESFSLAWAYGKWATRSMQTFFGVLIYVEPVMEGAVKGCFKPWAEPRGFEELQPRLRRSIAELHRIAGHCQGCNTALQGWAHEQANKGAPVERIAAWLTEIHTFGRFLTDDERGNHALNIECWKHWRQSRREASNNSVVTVSA